MIKKKIIRGICTHWGNENENMEENKNEYFDDNKTKV